MDSSLRWKCCSLRNADANVHWIDMCIDYIFAAPKPVGKHEFSDILDAHGFKATSDQESQTLSSLKKEQNKPDDPIKAKVKQ